MAQAAASEFFVTLRAAIRDRGRFVVALSGGNTPRAIHRAIGDAAETADWAETHVFFGDERCVPENDPRSNLRMARETLLSGVGIPGENVHGWRTEMSPQAAAKDYSAQLATVFGPGGPKFDLVFLGLGPDGHTASLFPGTTALAESERFAVANFVPLLGEWRLTLTFPAFDAARKVIFLVSGREKAAIFRQIREGRQDLPASRIQAAETIWLADAAAAGTG